MTIDLSEYIADNGRKSYAVHIGVCIYSDGKININTDFVKVAGLLKFDHVNFYYMRGKNLIMIFSETENKTSRKLTWHIKGKSAYINGKSLFNNFNLNINKISGMYTPIQAKTNSGEICYKINFADKQPLINIHGNRKQSAPPVSNVGDKLIID